MKKYDIPMDLSPNSIPGKIISRIAPGSSVLEFGCSYGRMTKYMKEHLQCEVCIVELDQEAFPVARQYAVDGYSGDIDQEGWYLHYAGRQFDRILFADVLEHLRDPLKALTRAGSLLKEDGEIVISLPNIGHNDVLVKLFQNRFEYTPTGLLDNTHIHFWGLNNLEELARQAGFGIRILDGVYQLPFHTEQNPAKKDVPGALLDALACREYNEIYQFFMTLQKQEWMQQHGLTCENKLQKFYSALEVHCYWDIGAGYQNEPGTRLPPKLLPDGRFQFYCDSIPQGCQKVRFDPPGGFYCLLSHTRVTTDMGDCAIYPLNGVSVNDIMVFSDTNPRLEFSLPQDTGWFALTTQLQLCSNADYRQVFSILEQQLSTLQAIRRQLDGPQVDKQDLPESQSLPREIQKLLAQREAYQKHNQWRDQIIQALNPYPYQADRLRAQLSDMMSSYNALTLQYQNIINSNFWKVTTTLRNLLTHLKTQRSRLFRKRTRSATVGNTKKANASLAPAPVDSAAYQNALSPKTLSQMVDQIPPMGGMVLNRDRIFVSGIASQRKILLVSFDLNPTDTTAALEYLAKLLSDQGFFPVIMAAYSGSLCDHLRDQGYPILLYDWVNQSNFVCKYADLFSAVVVCTIMGAPLAASLNGTATSVLWWIQDARSAYHKDIIAQLPETLEDNIHVYCSSDYAERLLKSYRPNYRTRQLPCGIPDEKSWTPARTISRLKYTQGKTVFALIGMTERRQGQDVLVRAIRALSPELLEQCLFIFVGGSYDHALLKEVLALAEEFPCNVQYFMELDRAHLIALYQQIDCLICACRNGPVPIAVTEAMMMSKAIICSENTEPAHLFKRRNAGLIYQDNNPQELAQCIEWIHTHKGQALAAMCREARTLYEQKFAPEQFQSAVTKIMQELCPAPPPFIPFEGKVSVIIPTYNAGDSLLPLLELLQSQHGVGSVEIVVVDSQSNDGTADRAEQLGAKVIRIRHADFSHSYARNLGAEHATGDYLLFLTQDATPDGTQWICALMQPVLQYGVVAVSCREDPLPDCDLLGKVSIWCHSEFMEILESDRILRLPENQDYFSMRKNAQLNDVTCLIDRSVFLQFKHQGDFGEDLDLGLRLIRSGYTLALLSTVRVIHSHTRPALYHMKRSLVSARSIIKMLPDMPFDEMDTPTAHQLANRVVTTYCIGSLYVKQAAMRTKPESWESFNQWSEHFFAQMKKQLHHEGGQTLLQNILADTPLETDLHTFANTLFRMYENRITPDTRLINNLAFFLLFIVPRYLAAHKIPFSPDVLEEMLDLAPKYMAQMFGTMLGSYAIANPENQDPTLEELIQQYSTGV